MTSSCKSRTGFWTGRKNAVKVIEGHSNKAGKGQRMDAAMQRAADGGILTKNIPEVCRRTHDKVRG